METSLHRDLKARYTPAGAPRIEAAVGAFRIDAIRGDGELVEIQHSALRQMRDKTLALRRTHRLRIVKPVVLRRRLQLRESADGPVLRERLSPKRGRLQDVFDELVHCPSIFPHANLVLELLPVELLEIRVPGRGKRRRRRAPEREVVAIDQQLLHTGEPFELRTAADLMALLGPVPDPFTSGDVVAATGIGARTATRALWVLRKIGALQEAGKCGRFRLVRRVPGVAIAQSPPPPPPPPFVIRATA